MKYIIVFALGFIVATVGVTNLANFTQRQLDHAKDYIVENVK